MEQDTTEDGGFVLEGAQGDDSGNMSVFACGNALRCLRVMRASHNQIRTSSLADRLIIGLFRVSAFGPCPHSNARRIGWELCPTDREGLAVAVAVEP